MLRSRSIIIHSTLDILSNMGTTEFDCLWLPKGKRFRDADAANHEVTSCCVLFFNSLTRTHKHSTFLGCLRSGGTQHGFSVLAGLQWCDLRVRSDEQRQDVDHHREENFQGSGHCATRD